MARETDNLANAADAAARAGEKAAADATKFVAETAKSGERAGEAAIQGGEALASATAERADAAAKAAGGAMDAAFKAMQDYNAKLIQVFQSNAEANIQLGQTLMQARSPTDVVETVSRSLRERTDLIVGQTKELAALRQEATRCVMQAIAPAGR